MEARIALVIRDYETRVLLLHHSTSVEQTWNRTMIFGLRGRRSTIELFAHLVVVRVELTPSESQSIDLPLNYTTVLPDQDSNLS